MEDLTKNKIDKTLLVFIFMMTKLSNKRQGIIENESDMNPYDQTKKDELILEIKEKFDMDYNEIIKLPYNDPRILEYESVLGNYLSEYLSQFRSSSFEEEMRILNSTVDINLNKFPRLEIEDHIDNKRIFSEIKESYNWVHKWILNPDYVSEIKTGGGASRLYFITKIVTNRYGRPSIFFAYLIEDPYLFENKYKIRFTLMSNYNRNIGRYKNPVHFFLNIIDKYGLEMEIGRGITKKLIFQDSLSLEQIIEFNKSIVNTSQKVKAFGSFFGSYNAIINEIDDKNANMLYFGINFEKYILDYKAKRI